MLKHYVEYLEPGSFFPEITVRQVATRDPEAAAAAAPKYAFAFTFFDREEVDQKGETLRGTAKDKSKRFYLGGELMDAERIEREVPDSEILVSNMRANGWAQVIRTPFGNFQPFQEGDTLLYRGAGVQG